jgi:SAM-dependent methyltransferase
MIKEFIKNILPLKTRITIRRQWCKVKYAGFSRKCTVCNAYVSRFLTYGDPSQPDFLCPICRSKPPHRLAAIYFQKFGCLFRPNTSFLHIAPEPELGIKLARKVSLNNGTYTSGGLNENGDRFIDLCNLPYPEHSIDVLYCCHVLNCMPDDMLAMREVKRVLKPTGTAILQVPAFCTEKETIEAPSEKDRLRFFRDLNIYRCYTDADYIKRLQLSGFAVTRFESSQFPDSIRISTGIHQEVLHTCTHLI